MSPVTELRRLTPDEWPTALDLRVASMTDSPAAFSSTVDKVRALPQHEWRARLEDNAWLAAFADGDAVALVCCIGSGVQRELGAMWVAPDHRGTGVGERLMTAAIDFARADGAERLTLWVVESNEPAVQLYRRCGFTPTGDRHPHVHAPDAHEMKMALPLA